MVLSVIALYTTRHISISLFFVSLYMSLVRPHLDYAVTVWSPFRFVYIEELEKVKMRSTKLTLKTRKLPYTERLNKLKLPKRRHDRNF